MSTLARWAAGEEAFGRFGMGVSTLAGWAPGRDAIYYEGPPAEIVTTEIMALACSFQIRFSILDAEGGGRSERF